MDSLTVLAESQLHKQSIKLSNDKIRISSFIIAQDTHHKASIVLLYDNKQ